MNSEITQVKIEDKGEVSDGDNSSRSVLIKVEPLVEPVIIKTEPELAQIYDASDEQHANPLEDISQVKREDNGEVSDGENNTRSVSIKLEAVIIKTEPELVQIYRESDVHYANPLEENTISLLEHFGLTKKTDTEEKRMALLLHLHNTTRIRPDTILEEQGGFLNMGFDHLFGVVLMQLSLHEDDLAEEAMRQDADTDVDEDGELAVQYNSDMDTDDDMDV